MLTPRMRSWWTPPIVERALNSYPDLSAAAESQYGAVEMVADLDRAIGRLPGHLRRAALNRWCQGEESEVGMRQVYRRSDEALEKITHFLCKSVSQHRT